MYLTYIKMSVRHLWTIDFFLRSWCSCRLLYKSTTDYSKSKTDKKFIEEISSRPICANLHSCYLHIVLFHIQSWKNRNNIYLLITGIEKMCQQNYFRILINIIIICFKKKLYSFFLVLIYTIRTKKNEYEFFLMKKNH